ncbi:MAG TPA: DUF1499 domain-containing protein [Microvirga sp.]|jgi:uncharacterized protein (DUF1499 family)|nr:DUF1499 domain-containing protein [Microvirga sp.]
MAIGIGLALAAAASFLVWRAGGFERAYAAAFGPPDLGPVDFTRIERRRTPNDALACPEGLCGAAVDIPAPVYPVPPERLRAIVAEVAAEEPGTEMVVSDDGLQDRYVVRTRLMRYPDTVNVEILDRGGGRSTLALYSRSQIGVSDFGVNRARVERWLRRIGEIAAAPPPLSEG